MANSPGRQRGGWWLGLAGACLAVGVLLGLYFWWTQQNFTADPKLFAEVGQTELLDDPPPPADSWPQWRGVRRDGVSGATGLRTDWPEQGLPVVWTYKHLNGGQSSPAVADGRVVTMTMTEDGEHELVLCLDAGTGDVQWQFPYDAKFSVPNQVSGPSSTPCLAGGRVFSVGATGLMHCLDAATGKKLWARDLLKDKDFAASNLRWGTSFSPVVDGNLVFVNPGGSKGSVAALTIATGETVWKNLDEPAGYDSPILVTIGGVRQVVFLTGRSLVGLRTTDGEVLWRFPWQTMHDVNATTPLWVRARAGGEELNYFFISSGYGKGCALVKVEPAGGSFRVGVAYTGNQLKTHFSSNVRVGEQIYGFDEPDSLTCLDVKTGTVRWKERGFGRGSVLVADGRLLVLSEQGRLMLIEPTPEGYQEKAAWQVFDAKCWSPPALAGGRLFVRDEKELVCVNVGKQ